MSTVAIPGEMPPARRFGWTLRDPEQALFNIDQRSNGQFTVVSNHPFLRDVTAETIAWWFRNYTRLRVILEDTPQYGGEAVPAYLLWHPSDHFGAALLGRTAADGAPIPGATKIRVQEAMQYERYGWRYPVNFELTVFCCAADGWAMGRHLPPLEGRNHVRNPLSGDSRRVFARPAKVRTRSYHRYSRALLHRDMGASAD